MTCVHEFHWAGVGAHIPFTHRVSISSEADMEAGVDHLHHVTVCVPSDIVDERDTLAGGKAKQWMEDNVGGDTATWKVCAVTPLSHGILGVNSRTYRDLTSSNPAYAGEVTLRWVLKEGSIGDYACYCGLGDPDCIARHGDKVSFEEACVHFPGGQLLEGLYRV